MCQMLLSINPEYVESILAGTKLYEYRKFRCRDDVDKIIIYATAPQKQVVAEAEIEYIVEDDDIKNIVASTNEEEAYVQNIDCVVEQITTFDIRAYFKELAKLANKMYPEDNE